MKRAWKILSRVGLGLLILVVVVTATAFTYGEWAIHRALPDHDSELKVPGLSAAVTVRWDTHGIPQVYANSAADLFRAQGYLHAADRFWEMDVRRHITAGRVAEMFGAGQLPTDKLLRAMGWRRVAEQEYAQTPQEVKGYLQAYAAGVNAYLDGKSTAALSFEYSLLGFSNSGYTPQKWDPVDSVAWFKAMAWDLRSNFDDEATRAALLAEGLPRDKVEQLYPPYPTDRNHPIVDNGTVAGGVFAAVPATPPATTPATAPISVTGAAMFSDLTAGLHAVDALIGPTGPDIGSNSWVLAGNRTSTGHPLLANDPHLAPSIPGTWYQMGLHCPSCGWDVAGFTFSGVPGVIIGHNARVAWGVTNLNADVTDLYLEKIDGDTYQVDGKWVPMQTRTETFKIAGGATASLVVRSTKHGPLLSDLTTNMKRISAKPDVDAGGAKLGTALRWTALDPGHTIEAVFEMDRASDWASFRAAAKDFDVPAQNLVYADVDGHIGYQAPGRIPIRGKGDGRWPVPGWDSAYDWTGYIPFEQLPTISDPASGYVATANNQIVPVGYPYLITQDWDYGFRSQRINDMITAHSGKITPDDVSAMQFDNRNGGAAILVPALLAVPTTGDTAKAQNLLRGWDFQQGKDSAPAAYYNAVWRAVLKHAFSDKLYKDFPADGGSRWFEVVRVLLADPASSWWDLTSTPQKESRDQLLQAAMDEATTELTGRLGDDPTKWHWGDLHQLTLANQTLGSSGVAPLEWLLNEGPAPVAGGGGIVNATGWNAPTGYDVNWVPSMRMIVDLGKFDDSRWIQLAGNSGHAFDDHYADQFPLWRDGQTLPMRWDSATIGREAQRTQMLTP